MASPTHEPETDPQTDGAPSEGTTGAGNSIDALAVASVALSAAGFLTLLKLADRRDRSPARALGLFFATSTESIAGTVLGLSAVGRAWEVSGPSRNLLLASAGAGLGVITTLLNFNWMRTRRRL